MNCSKCEESRGNGSRFATTRVHSLLKWDIVDLGFR